VAEIPERIGSYRVEQVLGTMGIAVVAEGVHDILPRVAQLKTLRASIAQVGAYAVQILREACVLETLHHPGVPMIYESGLLPDRRPWFATERTTGTSLSEHLARGALPVLEVTWLVRDIAAILEHAHRRGVIHAALRPETITLSPGRAMIADWSLSRAYESNNSAPPARGHYTAPELARGEAIDESADVYALGVIAYQAVTGALPRCHGDAPHIPTSERRPDAPQELAVLIDQMLAREPYDRPASDAIREDLQWLADVLHEPQPRARTQRWTPPLGGVPASIVAGEIRSSRSED
jgi:eukaryotic-like serine/threonine-protein kinase